MFIRFFSPKVWPELPLKQKWEELGSQLLIGSGRDSVVKVLNNSIATAGFESKQWDHLGT